MASQNREFYQKAGSGSISIGDIFSDVFRSHTKEESGRLLSAGTAVTTPPEADMLAQWIKPYMFLRILLAGLGIYLVTFFMVFYGGSISFLLIMFMIGSFLAPLAIMFFYWEMNIPRNISFTSVLLIFLIGGILSLIATVLLATINTADTVVMHYVGVGIFEEVAKIAAASVFMRDKDKKYILTGMLIGSAVGAGFSAMETIYYSIIKYNWSIDTMLMRGVLAIGGHVSWAAFSCGGLMWAKGGEKLQPKHFASSKFLGCAGISMALHAAWDIFGVTVKSCVPQIIFCVAIVILCFCLIRVGLQQVVQTTLLLNGGSYTQALKEGPVRPAAQPRAVDSTVRIQGVNGVYANRRFELRDVVRFGRLPKNDIIFPEGTPGVSGTHCQIMFQRGHIYIRDMNSTYGTFVNGRRIAPDTVVELFAGNIVSIGPGRELFRIDIK